MPNDLPDYADTLQAFTLGVFNWTQLAPSFALTGVPAWAQCLLFFSNDGTPVTFSVVGASGQVVQTPWGVNSISAIIKNQALQVVPGLDSSFTVTLTGIPNGITAGTITVIASPVLVPPYLPPPTMCNGAVDNRAGGAATAVILRSNFNGPAILHRLTITGVTAAAGAADPDQLEYGPGLEVVHSYVYGSTSGPIILPLTFDYRGDDDIGFILPFATTKTNNGLQLTVQPGYFVDGLAILTILG